MADSKLKREIGIVTLLALGTTMAAIATRRGNMNPAGYASPNLAPAIAHASLGFDRNDYPGDDALPALRRTFSFSSFWLNPPPGEKMNSWAGKREVLTKNDFGFLVLFTGRGGNELKSVSAATKLGASDSAAAFASAVHEGFAKGTIIFLDQEEGGRMLPEQKAYIYAWVDGVKASGFRAGIYCSAMPVNDGGEKVVTAEDIRDHANGRSIVYWVYNDACPPAPGCVYPPNPPRPSSSGFAEAAVWQFSQSPRRDEYTARCASTYNADDNCYPPNESGAGAIFLDLDTSESPDPSSAR
jgi:Domain of unknown function (DUF1906)